MKKSILIFLLVGMYVASSAQQSELFVPKEIKQAYKKGTRSVDGKPGVNYWQNTVDYKIKASVDPSTRLISGSESVTYVNNSPDNLNALVIRLYNDVFKKGNARGMAVNPKDIGDGVELSNLTVNGNSVDLSNNQMVNRSGTNMVIRLPQPLASGEKISFSVDWKQYVPLTVRRTGARDSTSFFVAYWYPQVSVYDDVFGWDNINYTFETEFYNNLANFDVQITAPDNFIIWGSGELQNASDVMPTQIYKKYEQAKKSSDVVHVVDGNDIKTLKLKSNTWHFKSTEVSDYSFGMSNHYQWDATSLQVDGRPVLISSAFPTEEAENYTKLTAVQQKAMKHFSEDAPGIPYPYPAFTTFIGLFGGGMESPMMANNDGPGEGVAIHEMYHTYFPMYVRVNERRWAWMDEGWADFMTSLVSMKYFSEPGTTGSIFSNFKMGVDGFSGGIGDLPVITSSQYTAENYGYQSYTLPAFTYALLYDYLGEELFLKCYQEYIRRWAKKSPTPYDYFNTFENVSGKDLSWLWKSWYFELGYADIAIKSFEKGTLTVEKKGIKPVPVVVSVEFKNGEKKEFSEKATVFNDGKKMVSIKIPDYKNVTSIAVNNDLPDGNIRDNYFPSLEQIYKNVQVPEVVLGSFKGNEYPVNVQLYMEEGVLMMKIPEAGMEAILKPKGENHYESLDGSLDFQVFKENGATTMELQLKMYGITLTGSKQ